MTNVFFSMPTRSLHEKRSSLILFPQISHTKTSPQSRKKNTKRSFEASTRIIEHADLN